MDVNKVDFDEFLEKAARVPRSAQLGVVLALLAAVAAGYYFLSYQDKAVQIGQLGEQANTLQRELNKVRAVAQNLPEFEQGVADLERELHVALKQLPNRKQFEDLLQDISTAGKKVGVTIKSIQRNPEVPRDFYAEVPFTVVLEGNYHELAMFFERVSRLPRIVNIGAMEISQMSESSNETVLRVKGRATTFRFLAKG